MHTNDTGEASGSGVPVLAIPGLGGGVHFFDGFAQRLKTEHRVLSVDLPGTWRSVGPESFSPEAISMNGWVDDLGALVADRLNEPAVLVGHSMGTIVALKCWRAWPERVRALILVGGLPRVRPGVRERLAERLETLQGARDLAGWGATVVPSNFSPVTVRDRPEIVALFARIFEAQRIESYVRSLEILLGSDASEFVPQVTAPVLAIVGADDQYAPPDTIAACLAALPNPPSIVVIPDCGHLPFLERPDDFAAAVKTFLASC